MFDKVKRKSSERIKENQRKQAERARIAREQAEEELALSVNVFNQKK